MHSPALLSKTIALMAIFLLTPTLTYSNGFVTTPSSRQNSCAQGTATNVGLCAAVIPEPDLISGPAGFPSPGGPPDALLCSGGNGKYFGLNVGYPGLWPLTEVPHGLNLTVAWNITQTAPTQKFEYFVSKPGLVEYKPLMREDFETESMWTLDVRAEVPVEGLVDHQIPVDRVPVWEGRGVIYAVWTLVGEADAFYGCLDVTFVKGDDESSLLVQGDL